MLPSTGLSGKGVADFSEVGIKAKRKGQERNTIGISDIFTVLHDTTTPHFVVRRKILTSPQSTQSYSRLLLKISQNISENPQQSQDLQECGSLEHLHNTHVTKSTNHEILQK